MFEEHGPKFMFVGAALLIGFTLYMNGNPPETINGKKIIQPTNEYHWIRKEDEVDGTLTVTHVPSGDEFTADLYSGNFYQLPGQSKDGTWSPRVRRDRYLVDPGLDIGTYASVTFDGDSDVGLRVSPARLAFGYLSPDLLISDDFVGVGLSLYPPREHFGNFWSHMGVGIGSLWDHRHSGDRDTALYLSFTTRN